MALSLRKNCGTNQVIAVTLLSFCILCIRNVIVCESDTSTVAYHLRLYNSINSLRARHTVASLKWNRTLTEMAEYFATRILTVTNSFDIDESEGINFFIAGPTKPPASVVADTWYNESLLYDFNNPGYNAIYLNFTQLIWKTSTSVGFGMHTVNNHTAVIAKFYPAGNIRGKFRQNVIPKYKKMRR
ncbi:Protein PRY1 [Orchesella cincta]|uniref:Protein PRY1 n=1 Tax=Orchesella cincta TaxID=48709 RepID=A0A1D2MSW3_ORCCI|nr:Protein PRY1 [Orchesella cincta]